MMAVGECMCTVKDVYCTVKYTAVLFVAHKYEFLYTFKYWKRNPFYNVSILFDFRTRFQNE